MQANGNILILTKQNNYIQFMGQAECCDKEVHRCTRFYFLSQSMSFLIGASNLFAFKVIINICYPITVFLIVLPLFSVGRAFPFFSA